MIFIAANGARIPAIGLGTWELRGRTCARLVEQALRLGYRHVDTDMRQISAMGSANRRLTDFGFAPNGIEPEI